MRASGTRRGEEVRAYAGGKKGRARLKGRTRVTVMVAVLGLVTAALYALAALLQLVLASGIHL